MKTFSKTGVVAVAMILSGCGGQSGFSDLESYIKKVDAKPRGQIEALPEVQAYKSFTYSAANRRAPFDQPVVVQVAKVQSEKAASNVKPDLDRPKEVLESFSITDLNMVGTLQRNEKDVLWALVSDVQGGIHMAKVGQHVGKNYGRIVAINEGRIDLIEIVPNGSGGWLERPRSIALDDQK